MHAQALLVLSQSAEILSLRQTHFVLLVLLSLPLRFLAVVPARCAIPPEVLSNVAQRQDGCLLRVLRPWVNLRSCKRVRSFVEIRRALVVRVASDRV